MKRIILFLLFLLGIPAAADVIDIKIPSPETTATVQDVEAPAPPTGDRVEVGMTSYSPNSLTIPSRVDQTSNATAAMPYLFAEYAFAPIQHFNVGDVSLKVGLGYVALDRSSVLLASDVETLSLFQLRAGVEFQPNALKSRYFSLRVGADALPSWVVSKRTPYDDGLSDTALGGEFSMALDTKLNLIWKGTDLVFSIVTNYQLGSLDGSTLSGYGIGGGLRVPL